MIYSHRYMFITKSKLCAFKNTTVTKHTPNT